MLSTRTITTVGAIVVALAAPAGANAQQDLRSPDARDAASGVSSTPVQQDLRSPDARDAASGVSSMPVQQDLRSPDARDAASVSVRPSVPAAPVERPRVSDGFEWGHAGIGGAAMLALVLALGGLTLLVTRRRVGAPFMH